MYESVYLYEKLKTLTINESYLESLNTITESCYDVSGVKSKIKETLEEIEEITESRKMSLLSKLKAKHTRAKNALKKNREKALKTRPIGLSNSKHKSIKSESEIRDIHETAIKYLNSFDPNTASDTLVKLFISEAHDNIQYKNICKILSGGKESLIISNVVTDTINKELTRDDITDAVSFLEKEPEMHDEYKNCSNPTKLEKLNSNDKTRQIAMNYKNALVAIVDEAYYDMMEQKMDLEFEQANRIMTKAAYYNPRNLNESYEVMEYIDSIFESCQY